MLLHDYMGKGGGLALWWHKQISFLQSEIVFKQSPVVVLKVMFFISGFSLIYIKTT